MTDEIYPNSCKFSIEGYCALAPGNRVLCKGEEADMRHCPEWNKIIRGIGTR